jgi:hypothetical protein
LAEFLSNAKIWNGFLKAFSGADVTAPDMECCASVICAPIAFWLSQFSNNVVEMHHS